MSGRPSWKSAEIGLFRPFSAFFALFRRVRRAPGKSRKRRKKAFFLRYPWISLNPHLLNPHLRHSNESSFGGCKWAWKLWTARRGTQPVIYPKLWGPALRLCNSIFLLRLLPRRILWIFSSCLPGNFALKNGGDFWWIFSGLRLPRNEARKVLEKFRENSEQNSGQNSGRKFEKFGKLSFCNFSGLTFFGSTLGAIFWYRDVFFVASRWPKSPFWHLDPFWYRDSAFCCSASRSSSSWDQPVRVSWTQHPVNWRSKRSQYRREDRKSRCQEKDISIPTKRVTRFFQGPPQPVLSPKFWRSQPASLKLLAVSLELLSCSTPCHLYNPQGIDIEKSTQTKRGYGIALKSPKTLTATIVL